MLLKSCKHRHPQGKVVVADAFQQRLVLDYSAVVLVCRNILTLLLLQLFESLFAVDALSDDKRIEPIILHKRLSSVLRTAVALLPFLYVTICPHCRKVASRDKIRAVLMRYEIGERQLPCVRMRLNLAHKH